MGKISPSEPALLFVATLCSEQEIFFQSEEILETNFGNSLLVSLPLPWDYSSYYREELGWPLERRFIFFKNLMDPGTLADIKITTNGIEDLLSVAGKRRINLDPGYLTLAKIVLASTKNYSHRIYLGKGIYGEVTLIYKNDTYKPHLFTYRDYKEQSCIDLFRSMRDKLKKMLR